MITPSWLFGSLRSFLYFLVAQMVRHLPTVLETQVQSLDREDLLEKGMATTPVFLPCPTSPHQKRGSKKCLTSLMARMVKRLAYNVGDLGSIPGLGRSSGEGNGTPLQYSCLENPMDRGAWWATVHGFTKRQTRLSDFTFTFFH